MRGNTIHSAPKALQHALASLTAGSKVGTRPLSHCKMACRITLPFWPTSVDCLDWSNNNSLAVAGSESIAILCPRLKGRGPNGTYWDTAVFEANAFTASEIPRRDPLSIDNFIIGEEVSTWQVSSLQWSSPGLSRYGGCALAVLTSNRVLSMWDSEGRSEVASNWKRKLVLNHSIRQHYRSDQTSAAESRGTMRNSEAEQVRQRVRSFAWLPISPNVLDKNAKPSSFNIHTQYLAVSTEGGDILILRIRSPYNLLKPDVKDWDCGVACTIRAGSAGDHGHSGFSVADSLTFSGARQSHQNQGEVLSYVADGRLHHALLRFRMDDQKTQVSFEGFLRCEGELGDTPILGPLRYFGSDRLISFGSDVAFCQSISKASGTASVQGRHTLDGRWDDISGAAVSSALT